MIHAKTSFLKLLKHRKTRKSDEFPLEECSRRNSSEHPSLDPNILCTRSNYRSYRNKE